AAAGQEHEAASRGVEDVAAAPDGQFAVEHVETLIFPVMNMQRRSVLDRGLKDAQGSARGVLRRLQARIVRQPRARRNDIASQEIGHAHMIPGGPGQRGRTFGFSVAAGSNAERILANSARSASVRASGSHGALSAPIPCSAEMDPPSDATKENTASSCRPSAGAAGTMFTCTFPSAPWPKVMTQAPGSPSATTAPTSAASRTHCAAGTETSSLTGTPRNPAASGWRSRYDQSRARSAADSAAAASRSPITPARSPNAPGPDASSSRYA